METREERIKCGNQETPMCVLVLLPGGCNPKLLPSLSRTHLADYVIDGVGEEEVAGRIERDAKWLPNAGADGKPIVPHGLPVV